MGSNPHKQLVVVMTEKEQSLCKTCGLCCDGTLFDSVAIEPHETVPDELGPVRVGDKDAFYQHCRCFNGVCTIYLCRPQACRQFKCLVLKDYQKQRSSYEASQTKIQRIISARASIEPAIDLNGRSFSKAVADFAKKHKNDKEFLKANGMLFLDIGIFYLSRAEFVRKKDDNMGG